jgi:transcriptional regulator with XRE-family HTH domain
MHAQALVTATVVPRAFPMWNMRRVGRKSASETPMQRARLARGLRQRDVAEALEVETPTIQRWETGARTPNAKDLAKLADVLEVSVDELLGRQPPADRPTTLPLPNEEQLAVAIRGFAQAFFPAIGPLDEESLRLCARAWRGLLASYAADPGRFDETGRTEFAVDLLSDQFASQQRRAPGR